MKKIYKWIGGVITAAIIIPLISYLVEPETTLHFVSKILSSIIPIFDFIIAQWLGMIIGFLVGLLAYRHLKKAFEKIMPPSLVNDLEIEAWRKKPNKENAEKLLNSLRIDARNIEAQNTPDLNVIGSEHPDEAYRIFMQRLKNIGVNTGSFQSIMLTAKLTGNQTGFYHNSAKLITEVLFTENIQGAIDRLSDYFQTWAKDSKISHD